MNVVCIRAAAIEDREHIWRILQPVFQAGETYAVARDVGRDDALAYWFGPGHEVFVAEDSDTVLGTYFLRGNQAGGGNHVANCGYVTAPAAQGKGVARAMLEHSLAHARSRGFRSMQFNYVVSTNERAVRTWLAYGFEIVGRLPGAFRHPRQGFVDVLIMFKDLRDD